MRPLPSLIICLAVFLSCAGFLHAQEEEWQKERAELQKVIDSRIKVELDKAISKKKVAAKLKWKWPVKPPVKTKAEIIRTLNAAIDRQAAAKFPETERVKFEEAAKLKYKLIKKHDRFVDKSDPSIYHKRRYTPEQADKIHDFTISLRQGIGTNTEIRQGRVYSISPDFVRIESMTNGAVWVPKDDMSEETRARFYPEIQEKFIERYIRRENFVYDRKIHEFKNQQLQERQPPSFTQAGYIPDFRKCKGKSRTKMAEFAQSLDPKDWIAKSEILTIFYEMQRKALEGELRPKITQEVFTSNGYSLVTEEGRNEWMPKAQAESVRERIKRMLAEKKAKEEQEKQGDIFDQGGPGGMPGEPGMPGGEPGMMPGEPGMGAPKAAPKADEGDIFAP